MVTLTLNYAYVLNNPLSYTDPSGFFFKSLFKAIGKLVKGVVKAVVGAVKAVLNNKVLRTIAGIAIAAFAPATLPAFVKGFAAGFVASGGDLKAGLIGGVTGSAFNFVGHSGSFGKFAEGFGSLGEKVIRTVAHGVVGGVSQAIRGGKFLAGFASAGFSQFLEQAKIYGKLGLSAPKNGLDYAKNAVVSAVVGGTASVLGGGKFKNGALTGAFSRLFNDVAASSQADAVRLAKQQASWATQACRESGSACNLSHSANASYVYRDRDGEFSASSPAIAHSDQLPNPGGAFNSINPNNGNVSIGILTYEYVQKDAVGLAVYQGYIYGADDRIDTFQNWADAIDGNVYVTREIPAAFPDRGMTLRNDVYCPGDSC